MMHKTKEEAEQWLIVLKAYGYEGEIVRWIRETHDRSLIRYNVKITPKTKE
jgi:hypothetical protein